MDVCDCLLHRQDESERLDDFDVRFIEMVEEFEWRVTIVMDPKYPTFAYTTGATHSFNGPEFCVFGLPQETAHSLLNDAVAKVRDGWSPQDNERSDDFIENFDVMFRFIKDEWYPYFFGWTSWFYRKRVPMMQMVLPDKKGQFPAEEVQPQLWRPIADEPDRLWQKYVRAVDSERA